MAGRSTPFGLFSGCSIGRVDGDTRLHVAPRAAYRRHTRLDMDYLFALAEALGKDEALQKGLRYRPNTSLYQAAGRFRYAESRLDGKLRSYHLVAVEPTPYLEATIERSRQGAFLADLAEALVDPDEDIGREDADAFIGDLVASQLLVPELMPAVTGPEPIHDLVAQLAAHPTGTAIAERLEAVRLRLAALDERGPGSSPERYREVVELLAGLPAEPELPRLFQVDMAKPAPDAALGGEPLAELLRGVALLHRLSPSPSGEDAMGRFREAFSSRYEGRSVPLAEALDEESGIGFDRSNAPSAEGSPLLEGLAFPPGDEEPMRWRGRQSLLLRKVEEAVAGQAMEITLDEEDLKALENPRPQALPTSFAIYGMFAAASEEALRGGDFRLIVQGVSGPSGANLLGRFCHVDPRLGEAVARYLRKEEALEPRALFAEIVHLPEGRIGNVLLRPVLREREIVYLGRSGAPPEHQIPITDLWVSVEGSRVVLRSASLGREIIPRLTTAHNFNLRGLGIYRFLCSLQFQGLSSFSFNWGPLEQAAFLPRVVAGRIVLSRARWRLPESVIKPLGELRGARMFQEVTALRRRLRLPRWVAVVDADNLLPVDLDNVLSIESFVHLVKGRHEVLLQEFFPGPGDLCATGPEGRFVHEVVLPLLRTPAEPRVASTSPPAAPRTSEAPETAATMAAGAPAPATPDALAEQGGRPTLSVPSAERSFLPGSEWLYAKIYCGTATADRVLSLLVAPLVEQSLSTGAADGWFFIRYGDPDWHVRLRLHGPPQRLAAEALPTLHAACAPLLESGELARVVLDTYEREVERYGGPQGILLAEQLFQADSEAALAIVETLAGDEGADARWRLTLRGIDFLLDDFAYPLEARHALLKRIRESFGREFRVNSLFEKQLGDRYRKERLALEELLDPTQEEESMLAPGFAILRRRSEQHAPIVARLREAERAGRLTLSIDQLLPSYIHMLANRLLRSAARAQELVLYDFLERIYLSRQVRGKKTGG
jgi:thiopeptide-type bacteriocin biosynthesis protein